MNPNFKFPLITSMSTLIVFLLIMLLIIIILIGCVFLNKNIGYIANSVNAFRIVFIATIKPNKLLREFISEEDISENQSKYKKDKREIRYQGICYLILFVFYLFFLFIAFLSNFIKMSESFIIFTFTFLSYSLFILVKNYFIVYKLKRKENLKSNGNSSKLQFVFSSIKDHNGVWSHIKYLFSIDYTLTYLSKNILIEFFAGNGKEERYRFYNFKKYKAMLLKIFNKVNFRITVSIYIVFWVLEVFIFKYQDNMVLYIIGMFILIRTISRAIEIMIAFITDIINNKKSSSLNGSARMKLAIVSFVELTLLFSITYKHIGMEGTLIDNTVRSIGIGTFTDVDLTEYVSEYIYIKNIDEDTQIIEKPKIIENTDTFKEYHDFTGIKIYNIFLDIRIIIILQIVSSMVLILGAFAKYLGDGQGSDLSREEDQDDYEEEQEKLDLFNRYEELAKIYGNKKAKDKIIEEINKDYLYTFFQEEKLWKIKEIKKIHRRQKIIYK